jgi:hypothetical protein
LPEPELNPVRFAFTFSVMEPPVGGLQMPSQELKNIKSRIAVIIAAINEVEVSLDGAKGKKILPLWSELKALRKQAETLETDEANKISSPDPVSESAEASTVSGALGCGFG